MKGHAAGVRDFCADRFQLASAERVEQVFAEPHPVSIAMRETFPNQLFGAGAQGVSNLRAKNRSGRD